VEELVLKDNQVRGLVIRPGCVYGKQGGLTGRWFAGAFVDKALEVIGDGQNRWTMVHVDDLAEAYLRAVESGLSGEAFNIADQSHPRVGEMVEAVAKVTGYQGNIGFTPLDEARKALGDFADCLVLDQQVDANKALGLLNWRPQHKGFIAGIKTYFEAWKAHQNLA
jgi:nucleoside-diphosphate-sugar epimerase